MALIGPKDKLRSQLRESWKSSRATLSCGGMKYPALLLVMLALVLPNTAHAEDWSLLKRPGAIAMMRHALAPGGGDPAGFTVRECSTQRNLDARGRAQARRIGAAMRERGIAFDAVLSSAWCRCLDTASEMAMGAVETFAPLNSFFGNRADGPAQTEALRDFLTDQPEDRRILLVTHQVTITALTGVFPSSGEIVVFDMTSEGAVDVLGTIEVDP